MAFRFPLATVLRVREIAEQREERLLGQILNQIVQAHQTLAEISAQRESLLRQRESALALCATGTELVHFDGQLQQLEALARAGKDHLTKLQTLRQHQTRIYEVAHRNRELLSSIKDSQLHRFSQSKLKQEQHAMDDNFSARRKRI